MLKSIFLQRYFLFSFSDYAQRMHQRPHEKLIAWQEARVLMKVTFELTKKFPSSERFELVDQMRRAAKSVPANIAEGNMRKTVKDRQHFFTICTGSIEELHAHSCLALDLDYMNQEDFNLINDHICRTSYLLNRFRAANF